MPKPNYEARYENGDKSIEISKNDGIRIWVDCDDVAWAAPDPRTVADRLAEWLNTQKFPTLLQSETKRIGRKPI